MIALRPFQTEVVDRVRDAFRTYRRPLLVSPTGSGKTVMFSYFTARHVEKGGRVLILVHRQELIDQVSETLKEFDVAHNIIAPGIGYNLGRANVASVFTLVRRTIEPPTLIIVDEAHHAVASTTWGRVMEQYPKARVLGVTATPIRLSGEGLGQVFDVLVNGPSTQQLIELGYLSRFRTFCPSAPDLTSVHKRMGDFKLSELAAAVDRPSLTGDAVTHYRRHADHRQAVVFCCSVEHAHHVAKDFMAAGYPAQAIDGSTPREWRREMIRDFKNRTLRVLASCDLISEGFDCPAIECGISLRPTHSLGLWLQQIGRCLRTHPGKDCAVILDHAGNALRHGLPTEERHWTLDGEAPGEGKERHASVRVCPKCFAAMAGHNKRCVLCGYEFVTEARTVAKKKGELQELTPEEIEAARLKQVDSDKKSLEVLTRLGRARGYSNPENWAKYVLAGQKRKKDRKIARPTEGAP